MTENTQIRVDSLDELLQEVQRLEKLLLDRVPKPRKASHEPKPEIWYRGHSHGRFELLPSLLREASALEDEEAILREYLRLQAGNRKEDWHAWFEMQHHFVPSRLLDWTESLNVALFFALREPERVDPTIYLLSPDLLHFAGKQKAPLGPRAVDEIRWPPETPTAIKPPFEEIRLEAQRGCFTIHGSSSDSLEKQARDSVEWVMLSEKAAHKAWAFIERSETSHTLFPDNFGLVEHIRKKFELDGRTDRRLASRLSARWRKDMSALSDPKDTGELLFAGLRGCAVDREYLEQKTSGDRQTLHEWLRSEETTRSCFILAGAGAGKTNYILNAVQAGFADGTADDGLNHAVGSPVVLWCALGQLEPGQELFEAVARSLTRMGDPGGAPVSADTVRTLCRSHQVLLVLDGLDELARTRGSQEARRVIGNAARELKTAPRLRLIVGCRDHIYDNFIRAWARELGELTEVRLLPLDESAVAEAVELTQNSSACKIMAAVPLFLAAARHLSLSSAALSKVGTEAQFRDLILRKATRGNFAKACQSLGTVAARMIEERRDFLSNTQLRTCPEEKETIECHKGGRWPLFVCEAGKEWRFVHQSIREYVLAWNIFDGFKRLGGREGLLARTSSLDFESAEVYCFVADLLDEDRSALNAVAKNCVQGWNGKPVAWNRMMRNLFEAVGMLGRSCSDETRKAVLRTATEIIRDPSKTDQRPYANFVTVYNAARCVERLHPSGPKSYCRYQMGRGEKPEPPFIKLQAYAVRGFQRKRRSVGNSPPFAFRDAERGTRHTSDDDDVCAALKNSLERLLGLAELDRNQLFIATNLSLALARCLPHDEDAVSWLRKQLTVAKKLSAPVRVNLELALWYRERAEFAHETLGRRVFAASELPRREFLQALVPAFTLKRSKGGVRLAVEIHRRTHWIWSNDGKSDMRRFYPADKSKLERLQLGLEGYLIDGNQQSPWKVHVTKTPFRFASGGTLPILAIGGVDYYCLFYREIDPIGWNIANGGCASIEEIERPGLAMQRELSEELVIVDPNKRCMYVLGGNPGGADAAVTQRLLKAVGKKLAVKTYKEQKLRLKTAPGPDEVAVSLWGTTTSTRGFFLNINAADRGIEVDQILRIEGLEPTAILLDGETEDPSREAGPVVGFVNAPVGLFRTAGFPDPTGNHEFVPDIVYWGGERYGVFPNETLGVDSDPKERLEVLHRFAKERLEAKAKADWDDYRATLDEGGACDLCPVTRSIIRRLPHAKGR